MRVRRIGSDLALRRVVEAAHATADPSEWLLATLGRFPEANVRQALAVDPLLKRVSPVFLLSSSSNWMAQETVDTDLKFLTKQNL